MLVASVIFIIFTFMAVLLSVIAFISTPHYRVVLNVNHGLRHIVSASPYVRVWEIEAALKHFDHHEMPRFMVVNYYESRL